MDDPATAGVTEGFGLMDYNARWYDPYLKQFSSPDSLIPDPYNSLDYNRYSYVRYNPLRYNDPSGHDVDCGIGDSYCNDAKREYNFSWRKHTKNSTFKTFMKAKDAYRFYNNHPDTALKDMFAESQGGSSWEDIDSYTLASIYSENVEHKVFNPVSDQFMLWEIDRLNTLHNSGQDVDPLYYYSLAAAFITFGPDGGNGGGGSGLTFGSHHFSLNGQNFGHSGKKHLSDSFFTCRWEIFVKKMS